MTDTDNLRSTGELQVPQGESQLAGIVLGSNATLTDGWTKASSITSQPGQHQTDGFFSHALNGLQNLENEALLAFSRRLTYAPGPSATTEAMQEGYHHLVQRR